jgi:hypothetical protein
MNKEYTIRVVDLKAKKDGKGFLEVTDNLYMVAETKQEARRAVHNQLTDAGLVYGRDFVLGSVGVYTGFGIGCGFVGDVFKTSLPMYIFSAYKNNIDKLCKYENFTHRVRSKVKPKTYVHNETYICSNGDFKLKN